MSDTKQEPDFDPALEAELRALAPAPVAAPLLERIEQAVKDDAARAAQPKRHPALDWRLWIMPATAAAAIAVIATLAPKQTTPQPASPAQPQQQLADKPAPAPAVAPAEEEPIDLFPAHRGNEVVSAVNEGIHYRDNQPYQRVRVKVMDSFTWETPNGARRVQFNLPREESILLPIPVH